MCNRCDVSPTGKTPFWYACIMNLFKPTGGAHPMRLSRTLLPASLAVVLALASNAADARMYRYQDDNGQMVISNTVPQEATVRGYEILNSRGRVVERVAPAPTEEELAAREAEERRRAAEAEQREADRALLRRFSHPDEAIRAMHRKIRELESLNQLKRGNISVIVSQLDSEQSRAADLERAGREVPDTTLQRIDRLQSQIQDIEREIEAQNREIEAIRDAYLQDIERLEIITETRRTLSIEPESVSGNTDP